MARSDPIRWHRPSPEPNGGKRDPSAAKHDGVRGSGERSRPCPDDAVADDAQAGGGGSARARPPRLRPLAGDAASRGADHRGGLGRRGGRAGRTPRRPRPRAVGRGQRCRRRDAARAGRGRRARPRHRRLRLGGAGAHRRLRDGGCARLRAEGEPVGRPGARGLARPRRSRLSAAPADRDGPQHPAGTGRQRGDRGHRTTADRAPARRVPPSPARLLQQGDRPRPRRSGGDGEGPRPGDHAEARGAEPHPVAVLAVRGAASV